ncbi:hypothetical protein Moror_4199 [Moniliophthora roreri MCA 2997]|uniref:Uncharacterized protein n=2 Tax=Moniliophthora roreri TaxID=221103 RepID=V2XDS9_MONRO|nr:hypothetical protein Moror_4199 [Moniliophthora roreri MCA 2997]KAI3597467.1 hypothetical protein WG66_013238 [Moniliophthora roreri]
MALCVYGRFKENPKHVWKREGESERAWIRRIHPKGPSLRPSTLNFLRGLKKGQSVEQWLKRFHENLKRLSRHKGPSRHKVERNCLRLRKMELDDSTSSSEPRTAPPSSPSNSRILDPQNPGASTSASARPALSSMGAPHRLRDTSGSEDDPEIWNITWTVHSHLVDLYNRSKARSSELRDEKAARDHERVSLEARVDELQTQLEEMKEDRDRSEAQVRDKEEELQALKEVLNAQRLVIQDFTADFGRDLIEMQKRLELFQERVLGSSLPNS